MITAFEQVEAAVRDIAKEFPDFVYKRPEDSHFCLYVHRQADETLEPGCIFGRALIRLGVNPGALLVGKGIIGLLQDLGIPTSNEQATWAHAVQSKQDRGTPWARAVQEADAVTSRTDARVS